MIYIDMSSHFEVLPAAWLVGGTNVRLVGYINVKTCQFGVVDTGRQGLDSANSDINMAVELTKTENRHKHSQLATSYIVILAINLDLHTCTAMFNQERKEKSTPLGDHNGSL